MNPASSPTAGTVAAALFALGLTACGGGTGDPAPAPPPPIGSDQINASNYLDAFWIGAFGVSRSADVLTLIDYAFTNALRAEVVPLPYNCSGGGTLTQTRTGSVRTLTFAHCTIGRAVFVSGTLSSPDAIPIDLSGFTYVGSGNFTLTDLVYRVAGGDMVDQTVSGSLRLERRDDRTVRLSGSFSVTRNGRDDRYRSLLATFAPRDIITVAPTVNTGSFIVDTPRIGASPMTVSGNASGLAVTSPDQTRLRGLVPADGSLISVTYEVTPPNATTPSLTQTLATSDPQVQAAIARVLR